MMLQLSSPHDPLHRRLMERQGFVPDYTALDASGATWLVANRPMVQLVGIDYLTVASYADLVEPHEILLGQVPPLLNCPLGGPWRPCWAGCLQNHAVPSPGGYSVPHLLAVTLW